VRLRDEPFTGRLALGTSYVGRRPLPFAETADPYALVDVSVGVGWRTLELSLAIENLLDARYRSAELHYASSFRDPELPPSRTPARHFSAGAPRTWLLTISGRLGL
jgi:outer membrane receptor protein involved in Fe transport